MRPCFFSGRFSLASTADCGPAAILRDAPFEFVHQLDRIVFDDVVDVAPQQRLRVERVENRREPLHVAQVIQVSAVQRLLHPGGARIHEQDVAGMLIDAVVDMQPQRAGDCRATACQILRRDVPAGNDEGNAGFINQDRVNFVE